MITQRPTNDDERRLHKDIGIGDPNEIGGTRVQFFLNCRQRHIQRCTGDKSHTRSGDRRKEHPKPGGAPTGVYFTF